MRQKSLSKEIDQTQPKSVFHTRLCAPPWLGSQHPRARDILYARLGPRRSHTRNLPLPHVWLGRLRHPRPKFKNWKCFCQNVWYVVRIRFSSCVRFIAKSQLASEVRKRVRVMWIPSKWNSQSVRVDITYVDAQIIQFYSYYTAWFLTHVSMISCQSPHMLVRTTKDNP